MNSRKGSWRKLIEKMIEYFFTPSNSSISLDVHVLFSPSSHFIDFISTQIYMNIHVIDYVSAQCWHCWFFSYFIVVYQKILLNLLHQKGLLIFHCHTHVKMAKTKTSLVLQKKISKNKCKLGEELIMPQNIIWIVHNGMRCRI